MTVYALQNGTLQPLQLAEPPLGKGGEGTVYRIKGHNNAAKIYLDADEAKARETKILEMVKISQSPRFSQLGIAKKVAWPLAPLYDQNHNFIGFGMNFIPYKYELSDLYTYPPAQNARITLQQKIKCLISLCDISEALHSVGQVVGDLNPNNIAIRDDFTVVLMDADSFHARNNGRTYRCVVCAPGYAAPEVITAVKGTTYADCPGTTFTKESDYFSLAVHAFRMLMNGCHPYNCKRETKPVGSAPAPRSTDQRVERGETPFFRQVKGFAAPPFAPDINSLPGYILNLFRRAFVNGQTNSHMRPTATEWKTALQHFSGELTKCHQGHYHWNGVRSCPYCEADDRFNKKPGAKMIRPASASQPVNQKQPHVQPVGPTFTQPLSQSAIISFLNAQPQTPAAVQPAPRPIPTVQKWGVTQTNSVKGKYRNPDTVEIYWAITLLITTALLIAGALFALPALGIVLEIYKSVFCMLLGIFGTFLYNFLLHERWCDYPEWWEWPVSVICGIGPAAILAWVLFVLG